MSYVIIETYKGDNYNWKDDQRDKLVFTSSSKTKAELKLQALEDQLSLISELWRQVDAEISVWGQTNPQPRGRPMRVEWADWREKHNTVLNEKCATVEQEHSLPKGCMRKTRDTLDYRIEEIEEL